MEILTNYPNIGSFLAQQLEQVGITSISYLKELGSKQAWLRIKAIDDSASINRLYSLEGAIRGIKKAELPEEIKQDLKTFYQKNK